MTAIAQLALVLLAIGTENAPDSGPIKNPGFESSNAIDAWEIVVYGARAQIGADADRPHDGKFALRVSASEPSDVALGQNVALRPNGWYRFNGWVRTRGLDPMGAPVSGTYQIQRPEGRGTLASGSSLRGDTDWTAVNLVFQAPADGRVRIAPFLVGYGRGKGTAWFDGLSIAEIDPTHAPAVVTRGMLRPGRIEPGQYGQFVEDLCTLVPAMWADKLDDGGFEGLSPYKFVYLKETDFREQPWYPSGATNRAQHEQDASTRINGKASRRIVVEGGPPCTVGVSQDGIAVEKGVACDFACYLKQDGVSAPVRIRLHHEGTEYASCEFQPTHEWRKYRARLTPTGTSDRATLTVEFRGPGKLWLDVASLVPEDAVSGWRKDVVAAVREMQPGVIRFGGSALDDPSLGDFEWRDTIGDPDRRPPFRAWGGLQPAAAGLEEIVQFCRLVGAEPLICVRITKRTPADAADQIRYFNADAKTPMGALRAKNGHPEPYNIRYWQVGNEQGGPEYEARLPEFCRAMKQADPSIQLLASYPSPNVIRGAGAWLDYVSPHHYDCANLADANADLEALRVMIKQYAPNRPIRVAVTEWNTTAGDWGPRRARLWTLENALAVARYQNLLHRQCDFVTIANRSNLINSFCSGFLQTDNQRLYMTPAYHAQKLYSTLAGDRPLRIDSALPPSAAPDLSATLSAKGDSVTLFAVNDAPEPLTRPLDFSAFGTAGQDLQVWTLTAADADATNSFGSPESVSPARSTFEAKVPRFEYRFPPRSLTVLRWMVGNPK